VPISESFQSPDFDRYAILRFDLVTPVDAALLASTFRELDSAYSSLYILYARATRVVQLALLSDIGALMRALNREMH